VGDNWWGFSKTWGRSNIRGDFEGGVWFAAI